MPPYPLSVKSARPGAPWLMAAWCALATGLLEVLLLFWDTRHGRNIHMSREFFWMTPLADLLLFGVVATLLVLARLATPRLAGPRAMAAVLAAIVALSILTHVHWMDWWAIVALAAGLGVLAGRLFDRFEAGTVRLMRFTLPVLAGLTGAAGYLGHTRTARAEQRAAPTGIPRPGAPNVLLIIWDTVRGSDLSLYGYPRATTPRLDAFAKGGVVFDRAQSPASFTLPSHASLFTGRWPHQLSASWTVGLDQTAPTLAEAMGRLGYRTGAFAANYSYVSWGYGVLRGFGRMEDYVFTPTTVITYAGLVRWLIRFGPVRTALGIDEEPERRSADDIRTQFLGWLDRSDGGQPFFAFLNMFDAHDPYLPKAPFDTLFGWPAGAGPGERTRVRRLNSVLPAELKPADLGRLRDQYDGGIAWMDHSVGTLLDTLAARGMLEHTLVIVSSDHGEAFGEHKMFGHGNGLYMEEVSIPLVMVMPGSVPAGIRVSAVASLRDVAATIGDLLGASGPSWPLAGRSLARLWSSQSSAAPPDTVVAEIDRRPREGQPWYPARRGDVRSITAWPYHLIMTGDVAELYDLATDPGEYHDLAARPEFGGRRDSLVVALQRWRQDAIPAKRRRSD